MRLRLEKASSKQGAKRAARLVPVNVLVFQPVTWPLVYFRCQQYGPHLLLLPLALDSRPGPETFLGAFVLFAASALALNEFHLLSFMQLGNWH